MIVPIISIAGVLGKPKQQVALDDSTSIEDQCHMLLKIVFENIQYIQYHPKNQQCWDIIDKVCKQNIRKNSSFILRNLRCMAISRMRI